MRILRVLLPLLVVGVMAITPVVASAAGSIVQIIPEGCYCPGGAPDWGCALQVVQNLMNVAIAIGFMVFVLAIVYAGLTFIASPVSAQGREMGKTILMNSVIGLVIMLCAWLLVDFVMKALYNPAASGVGVERLGPWNTILGQGGRACLLEREPPMGLAGISEVDPDRVGSGVTVGPASCDDIAGNELTVRNRLTGAGIPINKCPCPTGVSYSNVSGGCTTVGGLREATVNQAITLKGVCSALGLTGGNELGHTDGGRDHESGYKIDVSSAFDSCISNHTSDGYFKRDGLRGNFFRFEDKCGNEYVDEGSHWDITVTTNCPAS